MALDANYEAVACSCETCKGMCRQFPCRPLPREVEAMPVEVQRRLMVGRHLTGEHDHLQAAAVGFEGKDSPDFKPFMGMLDEPRACTFLTREGLCELHGRCKPFEGVQATCDGDDNTDEVLEELEAQWRSREGQRVLREWRERIKS